MKILMTGGAGFIGSNLAKRFIEKGHSVTVFDNLSRAGADKNLEWLSSIGKYEFIKGDVVNFSEIEKAVKKENFDAIFHLAAQVAVTTSITDPVKDFKVNALGSFNVLEAVRQNKQNPILLFSSTNKVYGGMEDEEIYLDKNKKMYCFKNHPQGINEKYPLDFHSPYGCSNGAADQYFKDYARTYGLKTVIMRQSCIYGYRQFGIEDQGWIAWFIIATLLNKPTTIYGDGFQVRDVLFIDDLIDLYEIIVEKINKAAGQIYNIGGGANNQISLVNFLDILGKKLGKKIEYKKEKMRLGDQKIYVSNISKVKKELDWEPKIPYSKGIELLINWIKENIHLFE